MNNLIRKYFVSVFCAPGIIVGILILVVILFLISSFVYQFFDKFRIPDYAKHFQNRLANNARWIDSMNSYSIEFRSNYNQGRGELSTIAPIIPGCTSISGVEFLIDSNRTIINNSISYRDSRHGLRINDSLFACQITSANLDNLKIWANRVRFLHDTLSVGKIRSSDKMVYFQFGSDLILKHEQKIDYICSDGIMFNEIRIDDKWKVLRNCVTF